MKKLTIALGVLVLVAAALPARAASPISGEIVLAPENNHLNAYSVETGERFRVITSAHEDPAGGRDINGQICFDPSNDGRFVAGEDTGQGGNGVAGWGYFELTADSDDGIAADQIGKLAPAYLGTPDNHGCGFLSDGSLVTATIGNVYPGEPANGELILWFRDSDGGFAQGYTTGGRDGLDTNTPFGTVPYCKLATDLATAGGVWVEGNDVYVAVNRPQGGDDGNPLGGEPGGVRKFSLATVPSLNGDGSITGCHQVTIDDQATGAPVTEWWVDDGTVTSEQLLTDLQVGFVNGMAATPSGIVASDHDTFYVSSVFTGTITEVDRDGHFVRPILVPGEGVAVDGAITPFGLGLDSNGDLWVADLGIVAVAPAPTFGSIVKIPIDDAGLPGIPVAIDTGLTYPDGLGIASITLG